MKFPAKLGRYILGPPVRGTHRSYVFETAHPRHRGPLVIKVVPKSLLGFGEAAALREEFERLAVLSHPHLVKVIDFGEDSSAVWLVTPKIAGIPLSDRQDRPPEKMLREWAGRLLEPLGYLHDRCIIHHDVKGSNVLVAPDGDPRTLKLIDLGLARRRYVRRSEEGPHGTRGFLAPELFGEGAIDGRVDLYAAGVLFRNLSGRDCSETFSAWLDRMTAPHPEERFPTAAAAAAALLGEKRVRVPLSPYLIESLPWVTVRREWRGLTEAAEKGEGLILIGCDPREREDLIRALMTEMLVRGKKALPIRTDREAEGLIGGSARECPDLLLLSGDATAAERRARLLRWVERVSLPVRIALFTECGRDPAGENGFEFGPLRESELSDLLRNLHPDLRFGGRDLRTLLERTGGSAASLRALLAAVLQKAPEVEAFRTELLSAAESFVPAEGAGAPPWNDAPFRVLVWAREPLPLSWFSGAAIPLDAWKNQGAVRTEEREGEVYLAPAAGWRVEQLSRDEKAWLRERLNARHVSLRAMEVSARLARRLDDAKLLAAATGRLVFRLLRHREYEKALFLLEAASGGEVKAPGATDGLRVRLLLEAGRAREARERIEALAPGRKKEKYAERLAYLEGRFAELLPTPDLWLRRGEYRKALMGAKERLRDRRLSLRMRAEMQRVAGLATYYLGHPRAARARLLEAKRLWRETGDPRGYFQTLNQLGMAAARLARWKEAALCYRHAASGTARSGNTRQATGCLLNLASVRFSLGEAGEAFALFTRCRATFEWLGLHREFVRTTQNLANLHLKIGNFERAERLLSEIDPWLGASGDRETAILQKLLRANLWLEQGKKEAVFALERELAADPDPTLFSGEKTQLRAEAAHLRGDLETAAALLERSADSPLHRSLLLAEWECRAGRIGAETVATRLRPHLEREEGESFFPLVHRIRFLGLLARASEKEGRPMPADLATLLRRDRLRVERTLPPELLGPLRARIRRWIGVGERKAAPEPASRAEAESIRSRQGREAMSWLLEIGQRITSAENPEPLMRGLVEEMLRMTGTPRGGVVLARGKTLEPSLFIGRDWEVESELPTDFSRSIASHAIKENRPLLISDARSRESGPWGASVAAHDLRGVVCIPLRFGGKPFGAVYLDHPDRPLSLEADDVMLLQSVADHLAIVLRMALDREEIRVEHRKAAALAERLQTARISEGRKLARATGGPAPGEEIWDSHGLAGVSGPLRRMIALAEKLALADTPVLITGEEGTEKERLARVMHALSRRRDGPFRAIDLAVVPEHLFETELFGYDAGAFTGAAASSPGLLRAAQGGTVLLESVSDLPPTSQVKLLRVLQEKTIRPVGSQAEVAVDVRFLAAAPPDVRGRIREDLYHRLAVAEVPVPPLRRRTEDLPYLTRHYLSGIAQRERSPVKRVTKLVLDRFAAYPWPGNSFELANELERASLFSEGARIDVQHLSDALRFFTPAAPARRGDRPKLSLLLRGSERQVLLKAIEEAGGNLSLAAARLGISRWTLRRKLKRSAAGSLTPG